MGLDATKPLPHCLVPLVEQDRHCMYPVHRVSQCLQCGTIGTSRWCRTCLYVMASTLSADTHATPPLCALHAPPFSAGVGDAAIWATLPQQQLGSTLRHPPKSNSSNGHYHSSAFASTLSGCNSSNAAETGFLSDASRSTRKFWYGTGGVFAGLANGTFGFMGTIGSLASSAGRGDSLRSTADLGAGAPAESEEASGVDDAMLLEEMTKAQVGGKASRFIRYCLAGCRLPQWVSSNHLRVQCQAMQPMRSQKRP